VSIDADRELEAIRWPDGIRCPACGSSDLARADRRYRCRRCRTPFCWSTGTALHATKLPAELWMRAVKATDTTHRGLAGALSVSVPTARRIAALLDTVPGIDPDARLRGLLAAPRPLPRRSRTSPTPPPHRSVANSPVPLGTPARLVAQSRALTNGERRVINALRHRPFGATARAVAGLSGVSVGHTRRCLRHLERLGVARVDIQARSWGYSQLRRRLWRLDYSGNSRCAQMLGLLTRSPVRAAATDDDMVPAEFWFCFWSGTPADQLRISTDGLLIAETLVGGHHPAARLWALNTLPAEVLRRCRSLRGCDTGKNAAAIDAALASRRG